MTAKGTEARQIWFTTRAEFVMVFTGSPNCHVVGVGGNDKTHVAKKTICQGGTQEYGTNRILNVAMGTP
jgi:hypothetical protein